MRKFKFRVWNPRKKCFLNSYKNEGRIFSGTSCYNDNDIEQFGGWDIWQRQDLGDVVQQFTGIQDSNGKDIYDGDIVEIDINHDKYLNSRHGVVYHKEYTYFVGIFDHAYSKEHMVNGNYCPFWYLSIWGRVVGNIFENFELLK